MTMTTAQETALTSALATLGITPVASDWTAIDAYVTERRDDLTAAYFTGLKKTAIGQMFMTDRAMVAAMVAATGSNALSDSILTKLDAAMGNSRSAKAIINRLYTDPVGINFGDPALIAWFTASTPSVFTQAEHDALVGLAAQPIVVPPLLISEALNGA
jgi:hypothetical protein